MRFRFILTEQPDCVPERQLQQVHGKVDGPTAAFRGTSVVPLRSGREDFELTAVGAHVPATAAIIFHRHIRRIDLAVDREQTQRFLAWDIPQGG